MVHPQPGRDSCPPLPVITETGTVGFYGSPPTRPGKLPATTGNHRDRHGCEITERTRGLLRFARPLTLYAKKKKEKRITSACCNCPPFSQALIAELSPMTSCSSKSLCRIPTSGPFQNPTNLNCILHNPLKGLLRLLPLRLLILLLTHNVSYASQSKSQESPGRPRKAQGSPEGPGRLRKAKEGQ